MLHTTSQKYQRDQGKKKKGKHLFPNLILLVIVISPSYLLTWFREKGKTKLEGNCCILSNWNRDMNEHLPMLSSTKDIDYQEKVGL